MRGRSCAKLTVVGLAPTFEGQHPRDPDQELTTLFAEEARLVADLAAVRTQLPAARERYAAKHQLNIMLPGIPRLRALLGPKNGGDQ